MKYGIFLIMFFLAYGIEAQEVEVYENFDDFEYLLHQEDDNIYVINFWATWCAPCIAEMPYFEKLGEKYKGENVEVILTSLDFADHLDRRVQPFVSRKKLKSRVVLMGDIRANSWIDKVDPSWSGAIPATLIYSGKKKKFMEREFASFEELEEAFLRFKKQ